MISCIEDYKWIAYIMILANFMLHFFCVKYNI